MPTISAPGCSVQQRRLKLQIIIAAALYGLQASSA